MKYKLYIANGRYRPIGASQKGMLLSFTDNALLETYRDMTFIFTPTITVLNKLKYSSKFKLLGFIVVSIVIFLSTLLYQQLNKVIVDSSIQLDGVEKVIAINDLIQLVQQYRGLSAGDLGKHKFFHQLYIKKEQETDIAFYKVIKSLDSSLTLKIGIGGLYNSNQLSSLWESLKKEHYTSSLEEDFEHHTLLIHRLRHLSAIMGDHYKLVTQGVLPSYYMIDMLLNNIPDTAESLGLIRGVTMGVLSSQDLSESNRRRLIQLESNLELTIKQFDHNLSKVIYYSPHLAKQSQLILASLVQAQIKIIKLLNTDIYSKKFNANPKNIWYDITSDIDNLYSLMHEQLVPSLNAHLEQRIKTESSKLMTMSAISAACLAIILYFLMALHKALLNNILHIRNAVKKYTQGDLEKRIQLISQDEMRDICTSINLMADTASKAQVTIDDERKRFKTMFETSGEGHVVIEDGVFTDCNQKAVNMLGYDTKADLMKHPHELSPMYQPDGCLSSEQANKMISQCLNEGANQFEWVHKKKNGTDFWVDVLLTRLNDNIKTIILVTWRDITVQKRLEVENELKRKESALSSRIFNETNEGVIITNSEGNITNINPAFSAITGFSRKDVIGKNANILNSGRQGPDFYNAMWKAIHEKGHWQGEVWNRKKSGELYAELLSISSLKNDEGKVLHHVGIFTDITLSKQQQETLELMAHYDVLTKLPNRVLFADRFSQAIAHSKRTKSLLAICFLDLDHFKPVNDTYGHEVGDRLLVEVAKRIQLIIREEDTVSRQGGDEFAILLSDIKSFAHCEQTLERIHYSLAQPYLIDNKKLNITASSGLTVYPQDPSDDADTLVRHADHAMYHSKQSGRNQFHLFNIKQNKEIIHKHHRLEEIKQALLNNEFQLYYQPKVNMKSGKVFGVEALIRWIHPENGLIPPLDFLPIIEGTELELLVGNWVMSEAISQLMTWKEQALDIEVSINISSYHLQSSGFISQLTNTLEKHSSIDSANIQLEILESSVLGDLETISHIINTCRYELGVNVALDDFGTGYSSLTHLKSLAANTIKIDQSFVRDMLDDPNDCAIIEGVIGLSASFGRRVIAEGVETTEHGLLLILMGCFEAQGYGIAKPMPAAKVLDWLESYEPNKQWLICGSRTLTLKERNLEMLKLIFSHWTQCFVLNTQSSPEKIKSWPIMNESVCPFSNWINKPQQKQLFEKQFLKALSEEHLVLHDIANSILIKYQKGENNFSQNGLQEFQDICQKVTNILDSV